ncbi:LysR family transcriptional regulator [Inquilinus sp. Marseille-Q2685]|uniref:LysR family transcriptional regulator n=1 Tax=Inquilinus sp. Marseille-Q2685 TaxID=2866581 RepID=UPI001CE3EB3D|nr:LysR family transcriptional regulator [Inquilinus sp. Marseille-Q2685]
MDWDDVRYAVALARHGSLSATARALGVNHATVSRRLDGLERALGRPLFDRRPDGYRPNAAGAAVLAEAKAMEAGALALLRRLDRVKAGPAGPVRLTTARTLALGFLIDRLDGLRRRHPGIELELVLETRITSLARREAEIALRLGRPADSALVGRRVATIAYRAYAAPAVAAEAATGGVPPLIGDAEGESEAAWLVRHHPGRPMAFRCDSQMAQAAAARAGWGVALLPRFLGDPDPGLAPVDLPALPPPREVWLLIRPDLAEVPRVRAVADALADLFRESRALFG